MLISTGEKDKVDQNLRWLTTQAIAYQIGGLSALASDLLALKMKGFTERKMILRVYLVCACYLPDEIEVLQKSK